MTLLWIVMKSVLLGFVFFLDPYETEGVFGGALGK